MDVTFIGNLITPMILVAIGLPIVIWVLNSLKGDEDMFGRSGDFVFWIPAMLVLLVVTQTILGGLNPANLLLNTTAANPNPIAVNDCSSVQQQMQQQVDQLNKDIASCQQQQVCGFQSGTFLFGMIVAGGIAFFLFRWNDREKAKFYSREIMKAVQEERKIMMKKKRKKK